MRDLIRKHALANALRYGTPQTGAIIGKLIAEDPKLKSKAKDLAKEVQKAVTEIVKLSKSQIREELERDHPDLLEKKQEERDPYAFLDLPDMARTAFPPGPEKYPHIGHAKALLLNQEAARSKNGTFILRFEDTNPATVAQEYYDAMLRDLEWVGGTWDELLYASDFMELFYAKVETLLRQGDAYVDRASQEAVKKSREKGEPTDDRENTTEKDLELWHQMPQGEEGSAIVRLKIDLKAKNTTLRDPTIFRIVKTPHPRQQKKYTVWPTYDFQNAVMDAYTNLDVRLRSKEFEIRVPLQRWIQERLGMKVTRTYEFGRFEIKGAETSGRAIREKVAKGELLGWDDPSLVTLAALRRRGFLPQAIKSFVLGTGISKAEAVMTWDDLIVQNKRLLDKTAKRFSAIPDPVDVTIEGAPEKDIELHLDPNEKEGGRPLHVTDIYLLSRKDIEMLKDGETFRLGGNLNAKKVNKKFVYLSESYENFSGKRIINFLPKDQTIDVEILMPNHEIVTAKAEKNVESVGEDEIVQFERFGFCRLDDKHARRFWFTHS